MHKKSLVHLVPTKQISGFGINAITGRMYTFQPVVVHEGYHLYITSDEEIKVGDWVMYIDGGSKDIRRVLRIINGRAYFTETTFAILNVLAKIIATTDRELWNYKKGKGYTYQEFGNPVAIPQVFILLFVSEYNSGNVIKEVMVKYEDFNFYDPRSKTGRHDSEKDCKLELNSDGSCIIHPIKERMYTRQEVTNILMHWHRSHVSEWSEKLLSDWLDKYYPK